MVVTTLLSSAGYTEKCTVFLPLGNSSNYSVTVFETPSLLYLCLGEEQHTGGFNCLCQTSFLLPQTGSPFSERGLSLCLFPCSPCGTQIQLH